MRTALTAIGLFSVVLAFAQDSTRARSRFEIGIFGSWDRNFRELSNTDGDDVFDLLIELRNDREIPRWACSAGLEVAYSMGEHWEVESGVQYINLGWQTEEFSDFVGMDPISNDPAIPGSTRYIDMFHYLGLPFMLRCHIGHHSLQFAPALGVIGSTMIGHTYVRIDEWPDGHGSREDLEDPGDYNSTTLLACADIGVIYHINDHVAFRLASIGRYQLNELIDAPITAHMWSAGLLAGVRYHF